MGKIKYSTQDVERILEMAENPARPDWDATEGKDSIKNRPFGFNKKIYLTDADDITAYGTDKIVYRFNNIVDCFLIYLTVCDYEDIYENISYRKLESGDVFYIYDYETPVEISMEFDEDDDGPFFAVVITCEEMSSLQTSIETSIILARDEDFLREPIPDLFIPDTIARQESIDELYEEVGALWEEMESAGGCVSLTYSELLSLRDSGQLVPGRCYRITDYITTTTQDNTQSAEHPFDVIVLALSESKLSEQAWATQSERDTDGYFAHSNLSAWKIWYCLDNDKERFGWASNKDAIYNGQSLYYRNPSLDTTNNGVPYYAWFCENLDVLVYTIKENPTEGELTYDDTFTEDWEIIKVIAKGKGVIYRMIDEWNNDCPYDFKNIQFRRGVYDGGGIAPDGDEDMNLYLFTFSFRTEDNEIIDTSIFGNNGRLLNDEGGIVGVYDNVIRLDMSFDSSISLPTKTVQRLNDIVFYSHYNHDGGLYYGCYSNSFGYNCRSNSFGDDCYNNRFGNGCYNNIFGSNFRDNRFGNFCYGNNFGSNCSDNRFGNFCYGNNFGSNCSDNSFGEGCFLNDFGNECTYNSFGSGYYGNRFGDGCQSNSFGNECYNNNFGNRCTRNSFGNECHDNSFGNFYRYNRVDDGVSVTLNNTETASDFYQVQNYHFTRGLAGQTIAVERNLAYETTVAVDSSGDVKQFCLADIIA